MPEPIQPENTGTDAGNSGWIDLDGPERCPRCGAASINVHGLADCPECSWAGPIQRR